MRVKNVINPPVHPHPDLPPVALPVCALALTGAVKTFTVSWGRKQLGSNGQSGIKLPSPALFSRTLRHALFALALLLPVICHAAEGNAEWNINQLMHDLAQARPDRASFVEKKSIAMLDKAVESSGELIYSAPDHLEKRTLKPKPESMVVNGGELIIERGIERGHKKYHLQLQDYPELAAFINSIRGTLAGDLKALEHNYKLSLDGTAEHWTLQLLPLEAKMQAVLQRIRISGVHEQVRSIEITQADGDSSVMTIEKMETP